MKSLINLWANFLMNHKLTPERVDPMKLVALAELLAAKGSPKHRPHTAQLESRRLVCETAMEAGIDLSSWKYHGKVAMARGLLDMWNTVYQQRYGSTFGTAGAKEVTRRDVKTKLADLSKEVTRG